VWGCVGFATGDGRGETIVWAKAEKEENSGGQRVSRSPFWGGGQKGDGEGGGLAGNWLKKENLYLGGFREKKNRITVGVAMATSSGGTKGGEKKLEELFSWWPRAKRSGGGRMCRFRPLLWEQHECCKERGNEERKECQNGGS